MFSSASIQVELTGKARLSGVSIGVAKLYVVEESLRTARLSQEQCTNIKDPRNRGSRRKLVAIGLVRRAEFECHPSCVITSPGSIRSNTDVGKCRRILYRNSKHIR